MYTAVACNYARQLMNNSIIPRAEIIIVLLLYINRVYRSVGRCAPGVSLTSGPRERERESELSRPDCGDSQSVCVYIYAG